MSAWDEVDKQFHDGVINFLRDWLSEAAPSYREAIAANPHKWWAEGGWHFFEGMSIRNALREAGFTDDQLPGVMYSDDLVKNWDDYYIEAIEEAVAE